MKRAGFAAVVTVCAAGCAAWAGQPQGTQPAVAPSAQQPGQPQRIDAVWVEQQTIKRLAEESDVIMREMGWGDDDRAWFVTQIIPPYVRPTLCRTNTDADDERMKRLLPPLFIGEVPKQNGLSMNQAGPRVHPHRTVFMAFFQPVYEKSGTTWWSEERLTGGRDTLPSTLLSPGLIRLSLYLHNDWGFSPKIVKETPEFIAAEVAAALREPGLSGERARMVACEIGRLHSGNCNIDFTVAAAEAYAQRPDADAWFADYFKGVTLVNAAWEARGDKWASETTDEQFKQFHALLRKAHQSLLSAHTRRPEWPYAAAELVTVTMGLEFPGESPMGWYNRALKADPADWRAGVAMATAAAPKWASKNAEKLVRELVSQSAASTDYRSAVPATAVEAVLEQAQDDPDTLRKVLRLPGVYDQVKQVLSGYIGAADSGMRAGVARTWLMMMAYYAGKAEDAMGVIQTPGFEPVLTDEFTQVQPQEVRRWAIVSLSPKKTTLREAEKALAEGRVRDAAVMYRRAAGELEAGTPSADLAAARAELIGRIERAYAGSEGVELLTPQLGPGSAAPLMCWRVERGWNVRFDERAAPAWIEFTPKRSGGRHTASDARVELPVPVGLQSGFPDGYELAFDVEFVGDGEKANGQLTVSLNRAPFGSDESVYGPAVIVAPTFCGLSDSYSDKPRPEPLKGGTPPTKEVHLKRHVCVLVSGWRAEVWEGETLVDWSAGRSTSDAGHEPGEWVMFGGVGWNGTVARLSGLTIRPLKQPLEKRPVRDRNPPSPKKPKK